MKRYSVYISDGEYTYRYEIRANDNAEAQNKIVRYHKALHPYCDIFRIQVYELWG